MDLSFSESFWNRGDYPQYYQNGSVAEAVTNPWYTSDKKAAPFDQGMSFPLPPIFSGPPPRTLIVICGEIELTPRLLLDPQRSCWRHKRFLPR
jgi:hypothetical protein